LACSAAKSAADHPSASNSTFQIEICLRPVYFVD
jgi:hypothetical protein